MRSSWRLWFRVALFVIVIVLIWVRFFSHRRGGSSSKSHVTDLSATSPLNQPGSQAAPPGSYDVYSALYQAPSPDPLVFAEYSITDIPQVDGSCLRPSTPQERAMTDAFVAANRQSHHWEQKFSIPQGYKVLPHSEVRQIQSCLATHGLDSGCESYKQLRYVRFLGVPGFDDAHTRALVSVIKSCGGFCGSGGIFAVEKSGDSWKRSETTDFTRNCSWIY